MYRGSRFGGRILRGSHPRWLPEGGTASHLSLVTRHLSLSSLGMAALGSKAEEVAEVDGAMGGGAGGVVSSVSSTVSSVQPTFRANPRRKSTLVVIGGPLIERQPKPALG